jgi:hypothetical protein
MKTYRYRRPETMGTDDYYEFKSNFDESDGQWLAEAAAEHYHNHCDGWEACWPITIVLQRQDGSEFGVYDVDREVVPEFRAREAN